MATTNRANLIRELIAQMETARQRMENILERNSDPEFRLDSDEFDEALDSAVRGLQRAMDNTNVNWEEARNNDERDTQRMRELIAAYDAAQAAQAADEEADRLAEERSDEEWRNYGPAAAGAGLPPPRNEAEAEEVRRLSKLGPS